MFRKLKLRLRALTRRDDISDEMELHIDQLTDEFAARGLSPQEARLAALRQFGNITLIQEQSRDLFSFRLLADMARDLSYAGRVFCRAPLFFAGAAFVLGLGIGANCAVFNLLHSVLLKPMPYERPEQVVMVWNARQRPGEEWRSGPTTSRSVLQWRDRKPGTFSDLAALKMWDGNPDAWFDLVLPDRAERLKAGLVTPNFFSVLGAQAALGRVFSQADESEGHDDLIVLSHALWKRALGGDAGILGRQLTFITGRGKQRLARSYTVIGVLQPEFRFTYPVATELWAINSWKAIEAEHPRAIEFNGGVARLAPGVSVEAAEARLADPQSSRSAGPAGRLSFTKVQPITEWVAGKTRPSILLMASVSLLLLMIACATVANAMFVRLAQRRRELAVRASLGAGRGRLIRQLLTEGVVLSLAGTAFGLLFATALVPIFRSVVPMELPRADEMTLDLRVLLFPAAAATLVTLLALLAPALQGSGLKVSDALKNYGGSPSAARCRFAFVAIQATIATSLLVGTALLLISFWRLNHVDLGFDGRQVLTAEMRVLDPRYFDQARLARFAQDVVERVRALPGVVDAGLTSAVPFRGVDWHYTIRRYGEKKAHEANARQVTPEYFSVMRLPLLRGRLLTTRDTASSERVLVISESFALRAFPGEDPIGKQVDLDGPRTIVGVVKDVRYQGLDKAPLPAIYIPRAQDPSELVCLVLRTSGDLEITASALQRIVHEVDPTVPVTGITTIGQIVSDSIASRRFYTTTVGAFALLALVLTASGLIVVTARSVAERGRELAIRSALGAQRPELMRLVIRQGLTPVVIGAMVGLLGAWSAARIIEQFLFGVRLHDPTVYGGAGMFTILVAAVACLVPARRAGEPCPAAALQSE